MTELGSAGGPEASTGGSPAPELPPETWVQVAALLRLADEAALSGVNRQLYQQFAGIRPARSQAELEAALADPDARLIVLLPGIGQLTVATMPVSGAPLVAETDVALNLGVVHVRANVPVSVSGNAKVYAYGSGPVTASGQAVVYAYGSGPVTATDQATVHATKAGPVTATGQATVYAYHAGQVTASEYAFVGIVGPVQVTASGQARVAALGSASVTGQGSEVRILVDDLAPVRAEPGTVRLLSVENWPVAAREFDEIWERCAPLVDQLEEHPVEADQLEEDRAEEGLGLQGDARDR